MLRLSRFAAAASTALVLAASSAGLTVLTAGGASAATVNTPLPAHVFAPYWEAYSGDDPLAESQASGDKYLTAAFIQTASSGSCTAYWDGDSSQPIASSTWGSDFATMQADGGGIIPSFGGYTADTTNTDIADSCTNVSSIAAVYENVITTYNVSRIDLDIEADSLTDTAGYTRRNEAVAQVEAWAAANNRTIQFSYTMPVTSTGLTSSEVDILQNAKTEGATVSLVNIMTFDYYIGTTQEMATDTETAAEGLYSQLQSLYPSDSSTQLWSMIGVTEMPGIDDYGAAETFTEADATTVLNWAEQQGISTLSFWALERDNGGCPGTGGSDSCSGISQPTWYFSNTFAPFTSGSTTPPPPTNGFSVADSPSSGSVAAGSSATATVSTAVTSGSAQTVALTASGAPSGVTVSFSPSSVTAGSSSTVTFATSSSTASGTYPITITGKGSSASETATYTLTVTGGTTSSGGSLVNGNFETGSLSPWVCQSGDTVQSTTVHSGKYALEEEPTGSATGECDQAVTLQPNTTYTLSGYVEGDYAFIGVSGGAATDTWSSSSSWNQLSLNFTTGSSGAVTIYIHGWYSEGNIYADDFTLTAG
jgi:hypothetical protein